MGTFSTEYAVIDGQQRMTTLMVLLSVIQGWAQQQPKNWDRLADEIHKTCLINEFAEGDERNKFMPTRRDLEPFHKIIGGDTPSDGTQVGKAWNYFNNMLYRGDKSNDAIDLRK